MRDDEVCLLKLGDKVVIKSDKERLKEYVGACGTVEELRMECDLSAGTMKPTITFRTPDRIITVDGEDVVLYTPEEEGLIIDGTTGSAIREGLACEPVDAFVNILDLPGKPKIEILEKAYLLEFLKRSSKEVIDRLYCVESVTGIVKDGDITLQNINIVPISEKALVDLIDEEHIFMYFRI